MNLKLNISGVEDFVKKSEINSYISANKEVVKNCLKGEAKYDNSLGWFNVDTYANKEQLERIKQVAKNIASRSEVLVLVGVGGSNRGAQAVIESLKASDCKTEVIYAGNNLSARYYKKIIEKIGIRSVHINIIAKDFKTLEPGIAFRMFRKYLKARYDVFDKKHLTITGSYGDNQLIELAKKHGYEFLEFPEKTGGRFSVFSAVGLLPMAVAGIDIDALIAAAKNAEKYLKQTSIEDNPAVIYAACRNLLEKKGFAVESMAFFEQELEYLSRWWLQLYGESEGKDGKGIYPAMASYSEDLHAIGQYIQEGKKIVFETFLKVLSENDLTILPSTDVCDNFDYLDNKMYDELNASVYKAAKSAHIAGGVPVLEIEGKLNVEFFGEAMYFFMLGVYISCSMQKVNPFNQEGVEAYKKDMYKMLGK